ncbi:MAG: manganese-dependent inorganic pyrophosphatase [Desulfuromonadaceae bacterium]|nr:manganese-dependent inorganic pyrophosphatase [Desulfuromonadaceae bacterium]
MHNINVFQADAGSVKSRCTITLIVAVVLHLFVILSCAEDKIIVIGHKSPDTDAVVSAITYANLKNILGMKEASPAVAGNLNNETRFVLDYFKVPYPELITDCQTHCNKVILVDHNDMAQTVDHLSMESVVEVLDHHRIGGLTTGTAIFFLNEPAGATAGIIANLYEQNRVPLSREMAGLLMSAILSDTVLFKSPTTTPRDKAAVAKLAAIAGIDEPMKFGMELFRVKSNIAARPARELVTGDIKTFNFNGIKAMVGQIEVMDLNDIAPRRAAILEEMNKIKDSEKLDMVVMMLTDVMKEASDLLFVGTAASAHGFEKAFAGRIIDNSIFRDKILSRKLQVVPPLDGAFKK